MDTYEKRMARIRNAVEMKPVDKIPVSINGPAFVAHAQGLTLKEAITDFDKATEAAISFMECVGTADSIQTPIMWPEGLSGAWLSKVTSPGFELGDDELWQVVEAEVVQFEDYDRIVEHGYSAFVKEVLENRLHVNMEKQAEFARANRVATHRCAQAGIPVVNALGTFSTPIEPICGGRGLANFIMDLVDEPELIHQVFDAVMEDTLKDHAAAIKAGDPLTSFGAWIGGWRAAPAMFSDDIFDEFIWPYFKKLALATIEAGVVPLFHLDSCWDRAFHHFTELPAHKSIIMLDGTSDIRKCREIIGDHTAIMGDVPASLLAFSTPDEVYDYTTKLIDDVGHRTGLIICSGCDIPLNGKYENVKAMVDAAADYLH